MATGLANLFFNIGTILVCSCLCASKVQLDYILKFWRLGSTSNRITDNSNLVTEMNSNSLLSPKLHSSSAASYLRWHSHPPGHRQPGDCGATSAIPSFHTHHILQMTHSCSFYFLNTSTIRQILESLWYFNTVLATGEIKTKPHVVSFCKVDLISGLEKRWGLIPCLQRQLLFLRLNSPSKNKIGITFLLENGWTFTPAIFLDQGCAVYIAQVLCRKSSLSDKILLILGPGPHMLSFYDGITNLPEQAGSPTGPSLHFSVTLYCLDFFTHLPLSGDCELLEARAVPLLLFCCSTFYLAHSRPSIVSKRYRVKGDWTSFIYSDYLLYVARNRWSGNY